jgi:hypothetical protein
MYVDCDKITRRANHFGLSEIMSSLEIKNISLYPNGKSVVHSAHPVLVRRASAVVTDVGRGAMDADVAET